MALVHRASHWKIILQQSYINTSLVPSGNAVLSSTLLYSVMSHLTPKSQMLLVFVTSIAAWNGIKCIVAGATALIMRDVVRRKTAVSTTVTLRNARS
jgi:hypothetical protein